jgi:hypothetical protein
MVAPTVDRIFWMDAHVTRHNTPIHNILSTAPQLNISHKAQGTIPEDGNVMLKHVILKRLTARRLYKSFGVKGLTRQSI